MVSAIIVTRGDVDMAPVLDSLPDEWEKIEWDNYVGGPRKKIRGPQGWIDEWNGVAGADGPVIGDLSVYGRYAAIEYATGDLIYVQDDDVIVSDPPALVDKWIGTASLAGPVPADGSDLSNVETFNHIVCNMPPQFRHDFYEDHSLVGFGACFHRDSPKKAFENLYVQSEIVKIDEAQQVFYRTCDVVFTTLTPRVLVDVPIEHREFASAPNRMWKQKDHFGERLKMLQLARQVRDGG